MQFSLQFPEFRLIHIAWNPCRFGNPKVWIENGIEIAWNRGFAEAESNDILRMIETHLKLINETYEQLLA